jgi:exodeoxyribonuclease III
MKRLHKHAGKLLKANAPVVIAGDFNVAPTSLDIYPAKSWDKDALIQPASRKAYTKLIKQGWTDAVRTLNPEKRIYTFWTYWRNRYQRNDGLRLDHLLLSPELAHRLKRVGVDQSIRGEENASDHSPAWVFLK